MFNLPINSKISGNTVYHKGNHNERENPHNQYHHKWDIINTINNRSVTGQYTKLLDITYEVDTNRVDNYWLTIFNTKNQQTYDLIINLGSTRNIKYPYNSDFEIWYTQEQLDNSSNGKENWKVTVYLKLWKSYNTMFVSLNMAKNNEVYNYDNDYAFNNINLYSNQALQETISNLVQGTNNASPSQRTFWHRQSWGEVVVSAGGKMQIIVSNSNIQWDSVVNFCYSVEIPSELMYNVSIKSGGGYAIINVRNVSNINATWPSGQILLSIQQSF